MFSATSCVGCAALVRSASSGERRPIAVRSARHERDGNVRCHDAGPVPAWRVTRIDATKPRERGPCSTEASCLRRHAQR